MLHAKPCPNCGNQHGHSPWKVANSSLAKPLKCLRCGQYFHQVGLGALLAVSLLFPTSLLSWLAAVALIEIAPDAPFAFVIGVAFVLASAIELLSLLVYVNRRYPLASGPRCVFKTKSPG